LHVILKEEDSLNWSLEEVEDLMEESKYKLTEEDLDQPLMSAEEEEGGEKGKCSTALDTRAFVAPLQDLRKLVDTSLGLFNGPEYKNCSTNRTGLRAYDMIFKEMKEKTKQLPSEHFCKEQKLRPAKLSHKIILKVRRQ
jgi:hypothetical protein